MIDALTGRLEAVGDGELRLRVGPVTVRALVSPYAARVLAARVGEELTLPTALYLQGPGMGSLVPVLLAFCSAQERAFYELLAGLDGLGPRAALRIMAEPVPAIAAAIARGDVAWLQRLPGVGRQRAAELVSRLRPRVAPFLAGEDEAGTGDGEPAPGRLADDVRADVLAVLAQLGYGPREAERMLAAALARRPDAARAEELLREVFRGLAPGAAGPAVGAGGGSVPPAEVSEP